MRVPRFVVIFIKIGLLLKKKKVKAFTKYINKYGGSKKFIELCKLQNNLFRFINLNKDPL